MNTSSALPSPAPLPGDPAGSPQPLAAPPDEEPDSPGRLSRPLSPLRSSADSLSDDPLATVLPLLSGMAIGLLSVLVPLATVVTDPARTSLLAPTWRLELADDGRAGNLGTTPAIRRDLRQVGWRAAP